MKDTSDWEPRTWRAATVVSSTDSDQPTTEYIDSADVGHTPHQSRVETVAAGLHYCQLQYTVHQTHQLSIKQQDEVNYSLNQLTDLGRVNLLIATS